MPNSMNTSEIEEFEQPTTYTDPNQIVLIVNGKMYLSANY